MGGSREDLLGGGPSPCMCCGTAPGGVGGLGPIPDHVRGAPWGWSSDMLVFPANCCDFSCAARVQKHHGASKGDGSLSAPYSTPEGHWGAPQEM